MDEFEIEEETGGYIRVGDVLEWRYKQKPGASEPSASSADEPKSKATRAKVPRAKKAE